MTHPAVERRRVADSVKRRAAPAQIITVQKGTVTRVVAGGALDGRDQVTVTVAGDEMPAPYLDGTTYHSGDTVRVEFVDGSPTITGRIVGYPNLGG